MHVVAIMAVMHCCWSLNKISSPGLWIRVVKRFSCNISSPPREKKKKKVWCVTVFTRLHTHRDTHTHISRCNKSNYQRKEWGVMTLRIYQLQLCFVIELFFFFSGVCCLTSRWPHWTKQYNGTWYVTTHWLLTSIINRIDWCGHPGFFCAIINFSALFRGKGWDFMHRNSSF